MVFDPNIPYNDLPRLPGNFDYNQVSILKSALKANNYLAKLNGLSQLVPNADLLISPLLVKESVASSAIENINTTTQKVLQEEAIREKKLIWPEKEVLHYRQALLFGIKELQKYGGISTNMLIDIQKVLEPSKSGIRSLPGTVIANATTGEVYHTPPEGEENIRDLLGNLEQFINTTNDDIDPLIKIGVIHYQFESIHPFYDGNGRTGRMLLILYLLLTKKLEYPVLFISEFINKTKSQYYQLLNTTSKVGSYTDIILYFLEAIAQQAQQTEQKILAIKTLMEKTEKTIWRQSKLDYHRITTILFSNPYSTVLDFGEHMGVTKATAIRTIKILQTLEVIQTKSVGRNTLISIPEFIELLS